MISRILCFAHSMLANTRNSDPAHSLNIHHNGNCHKHREYRICRGPKKDEKDTYIPSHPQSGPTPGSDALTHQVIVFVGGVAQHERADNGHEAVSYTHLRAHETDSYLVCR